MNGRVELILAAILLLLFSTAPSAFIANANPTFVNRYPVTVAVASPKENASLPTGPVVISFSLRDVPFFQTSCRTHVPFGVAVYVDDKYNTGKRVQYYPVHASNDYSIILENLTEGKHSIRITVGYGEQTDAVGRNWIELSGSSEIQVEVSKENQFTPRGVTFSDPSAKPSKIDISSPANNTLYPSAPAASNLLFSLNVSLPESSAATNTYITKVYYESDWQQESTQIYNSGTTNIDSRIDSSSTNPRNWVFIYSTNLTAVPVGNRSITVYAVSGASYWHGVSGDGTLFDTLELVSNSTVFFTIGINNPTEGPTSHLAPSSSPSASQTPPVTPSVTRSPTQTPTPTIQIPFVDPPDPTKSYIFYFIIIVATLFAVGFTIFFAERRRLKQ